jgi:hypothetical protein
MLKRKTLWLLLASGIVLQFSCNLQLPSLFSGTGLTTLLTTLDSYLPASLQTYVNALIKLLPTG